MLPSTAGLELCCGKISSDSVCNDTCIRVSENMVTRPCAAVNNAFFVNSCALTVRASQLGLIIATRKKCLTARVVCVCLHPANA